MAGYLVSIAIQVGIYMLLTLALNLQYGMTGLVNFGLVAFYCIGAYATALASPVVGMAGGLVVAMLLGAIAALPIGALTLRLRAEYLAIMTLGFAETIRLVAVNEAWLTHGAGGFSGIVQPFAGSVTPQTSDRLYLSLLTVIVTIAVLAMRRLAASPLGRLMRAIRDREDTVRALGKSPARVKLVALTGGAALAGLAGALQAHYVGYISPDQFGAEVTFFCWMAMIIGGTGRIAGSLAGAALLLSFTEGTRFLRDVVPLVDDVQMANLRLAAVGLALILFSRYRPQGLLPERG